MKFDKKGLKVLIVGLYLISIYLIISPLLPGFLNGLFQYFDGTKGYKYAGEYVSNNLDELGIEGEELRPIPENNVLVIPKIGVDGEIFEGDSEYTLSKGIWRRPKTAKPGESSNIVLAAHRYKDILAPNSFYNLDKLTVNDQVIVYWKGKEHIYEVSEKKVVPATALEIENPSTYEKVTLYTCEPLYSAEYRLVITALPLNEVDGKSVLPLPVE